MSHLTTFRGPVTDGRYDELRFISHETDMTDVEVGRFGLSRETDRGGVVAQFSIDSVAFTVPHVYDWQGIAEKRVKYFSQPWDSGGCELYPTEAVP